ncbi:hypothetical protein BDW71DRAFT_187178 [Aspergillus fruticulosus]
MGISLCSFLFCVTTTRLPDRSLSNDAFSPLLNTPDPVDHDRSNRSLQTSRSIRRVNSFDLPVQTMLSSAAEETAGPSLQLRPPGAFINHGPP